MMYMHSPGIVAICMASTSTRNMPSTTRFKKADRAGNTVGRLSVRRYGTHVSKGTPLLIINRPDKLNAFTPALMRELDDARHDIDGNLRKAEPRRLGGDDEVLTLSKAEQTIAVPTVSVCVLGSPDPGGPRTPPCQPAHATATSRRPRSTAASSAFPADDGRARRRHRGDPRAARPQTLPSLKPF